MQGETRPSVQRGGAWLYALASAVLALVAFHPNVRPIFLVVIFVVMLVLFRIVWGWYFSELFPQTFCTFPREFSSDRRQ